MTIAQVIADSLRARGLTQAAAASLLEVTQTTVGRWLRGTSIPRAEHVGRLADFTGLSEPEVLVAIHRQQTLQPQVEERIAALEAQVKRLVELLEGQAPIEGG